MEETPATVIEVQMVHPTEEYSIEAAPEVE